MGCFTKSDKIVLSFSTLFVAYISLEISSCVNSSLISLGILLFCIANLCYINTSTKETL